MTAGQTIEKLFNACRVAGVDAEKVFQHCDTDDIDAYAEALEQGWIPEDDLPRWMSCTAATIASGRCLCPACKRLAT